jgi:hypothetical protein
MVERPVQDLAAVKSEVSAGSRTLIPLRLNELSAGLAVYIFKSRLAHR